MFTKVIEILFTDILALYSISTSLLDRRSATRLDLR